jgi:hypothetical protein
MVNDSATRSALKDRLSGNSAWRHQGFGPRENPQKLYHHKQNEAGSSYSDAKLAIVRPFSMLVASQGSLCERFFLPPQWMQLLNTLSSCIWSQALIGYFNHDLLMGNSLTFFPANELSCDNYSSFSNSGICGVFKGKIQSLWQNKEIIFLWSILVLFSNLQQSVKETRETYWCCSFICDNFLLTILYIFYISNW